MQRIALARQALLVQKCKQTQLENPGVRVKCEVLLYLLLYSILILFKVKTSFASKSSSSSQKKLKNKNKTNGAKLCLNKFIHFI